jgi:prevent-host-death family protein
MKSVDRWQLQDAKAKFSRLVDETLRRGPQVVTRRGVETAVLVPIEEWRRLQRSVRPSLKEILLEPRGRFSGEPVKRGRLRRRPALEF